MAALELPNIRVLPSFLLDLNRSGTYYVMRKVTSTSGGTFATFESPTTARNALTSFHGGPDLMGSEGRTGTCIDCYVLQEIPHLVL